MSKSEQAMTQLRDYVRRIQVYPCSEIFYQADSSKSKAERRCASICESLYSLNEYTISNVRDALHELSVLYNMGFDCIQKPEYLKSTEDNLLICLQIAVQELDTMHKKDQILNNYYKSFRLSYQTLKTMVSDVTYDFWEMHKDEE